MNLLCQNLDILILLFNSLLFLLEHEEYLLALMKQVIHEVFPVVVRFPNVLVGQLLSLEEDVLVELKIFILDVVLLDYSQVLLFF